MLHVLENSGRSHSDATRAHTHTHSDTTDPAAYHKLHSYVKARPRYRQKRVKSISTNTTVLKSCERQNQLQKAAQLINPAGTRKAYT